MNRPKAISKGSRIAIVAPARSAPPHRMDDVMDECNEAIRSLGYVPVEGKHARGNDLPVEHLVSGGYGYPQALENCLGPLLDLWCKSCVCHCRLRHLFLPQRLFVYHYDTHWRLIRQGSVSRSMTLTPTSRDKCQYFNNVPMPFPILGLGVQFPGGQAEQMKCIVGDRAALLGGDSRDSSTRSMTSAGLLSTFQQAPPVPDPMLFSTGLQMIQ